ncbi:uncharacterized protein TM35_000212590 [Trypanosoma theileri]|uniref:Uncharacterized protein n=1 Tax=Trypanosoma theileri TaxID=67003 RepID=A0A1X0NT58_9TRYP|nr:uncharacterized protein TM35_000212590 [Trypanosoma theileri]ORC87653.1 hypothetical protein TM35_000212590 [Trypanosoma theileri]
MLRCCSSVLRTSTSVDLAFRRALGSQSTLLDLVPVKKPLIDGSLCWFIEENIDIVLVSGVKGTSPDEVTDGVKLRATHLLQQCGDGDAVKGCYALKRCVQEAVTVRHLLRRLDLQVLLRVWDESPTTKTSLEMSSDDFKYDSDVKLHCSIYEIDTWEPHKEKRHLKDISAFPSEVSLDQLLRRALHVVEQDAEKKEQQFALASFLEARLLLLHGSASPFPIRFNHSVSFSERENEVMCSSSSFKGRMESNPMMVFAEDPATRWIVSSTSYKVDLEFLRYSIEGSDHQKFISGTWKLQDNVGNTERCDVPLVTLKNKKGLIFGSHSLDMKGQKHQQQEEQEEEEMVDEDTLEKLENAGKLIRVSYLEGKQHVSKVLRLLWDQPILQSLLFYTSVEFFCGRLSCTRAEDYVKSCGRLEIDSWLNDQGRQTTIPMPPLYLRYFTSLDFLQECLPLEMGSRIMLFTQLGPLHLSYHVAAASGDRVVTPMSCFSSATAALSALLPWYTATPLRPVVSEQNYPHHHQHHNHNHQQQQKPSENSTATETAGGSGEQTTKPTEDASLNTVRVLDVEAVLKKMGVVSGTFASDRLEYFDTSGRKLLEFDQMDTLNGIERLVRCLRRKRAASFTTISLHEGARAPHIIAGRALAGFAANKMPPYVKRVRIPVPLVPGEFFGIRFAGLLELEQLECRLLSIFEEYAEDPTQWPLRRRTPCFFNRWRFTRGIIAAIMRHDDKFRYTIDPPLGEKGSRTLLLRLYSGDTVMREITVQEEAVLLQVRNCFAEYANQWIVDLPPIEDVLFGMLDIKKTTSFSYRTVLNAMLQNSEVYTTNEDTVSLELRISSDVSVILSSEKSGGTPESKEMISRSFVVRQFAMLLPLIALLQRAQLIISELKDNGGAVFHCQDNTAVGRGFRWELKKQTDNLNKYEVIDAVEGMSRWVALGELVDRYPLQKEARKPVKEFRKPAKEVTINQKIKYGLTIEECQAILGRKYGVQKIIHEYNRDNNEFIVKGLNCDTQKESRTTSLIRVIALKEKDSIGHVIHRYYWKELEIPNPPALSFEDLRLRSLQSIYNLCQPYFTLALPPLNDSLSEVLTKKGWCVVLKLPGNLFAFETLKHVEYVYLGRGKHEGRREVMRQFYNSIFGNASSTTEQVLLNAFKNDPVSHPEVSTAINSINPGIQGKTRTSTSLSSSLSVPTAVTPCGKDACMYSELMRVIGNALQSHVGYDGVVECRLSFMTGIKCRYVRQPFSHGDQVDLFNVPLRSTLWLPLQLLCELMSCALRLLSETVLTDLLLRASSEWPSVFLDMNKNERLFCTTFLRRYLGLYSYEENDVDPRAAVPGTIYLVESTRSVSGGNVEASLLLLQTPLPPHTATFKKSLALEKGTSLSRAELGLWSNVAQQLEHLLEGIQKHNIQHAQQRDVDKAVFSFLSRLAMDEGR